MLGANSEGFAVGVDEKIAIDDEPDLYRYPKKRRKHEGCWR